MKHLLKYAQSGKQAEAVQAYIDEGSLRAGARKIGMSYSTFHYQISQVKRFASIQGESPEHDMTRSVPDPFCVKGVSSYYNKEGELSGQWVKSSLKHDQLIQVMREVVDELKKDITPIEPIKLHTPSKQIDENLFNLHIYTDMHIGALAWKEENRKRNWDISACIETVDRAEEHLIGNSPAAETGMLCQLGDALHWDGLIPKTPGSGHILEGDGRFHKLVRTAIRIFRRSVIKMLAKYNKVIVLMARGNHDEASSVWLQEMFSVLLEDNPRVEVIVSPLPYYALTHGEVMLGFHHGDKRLGGKLADTFVGYFRQLYGKTKSTFIHSGHHHTRKVDEFGSAEVEQHPTIAAAGSYEAYEGYVSKSSMPCITYHGPKTCR